MSSEHAPDLTYTPRLPTAVDLSCSVGLTIEAQDVWRDLRYRVSRFINHENLPEIVFHKSKLGTFLLKKTVKRDLAGKGAADISPGERTQHWRLLDSILLAPLVDQEECLLGRWVAWLLLRELFALSGMFDGGGVFDLIIPFEGEKKRLTPLEDFLAQSKMPHTWEDLGAASWGIFAVMARFSRVYRTLTQKMGSRMAGLNLTQMIDLFDRLSADSQCPFVREIEALASRITAIAGNGTGTDTPWNTIAAMALQSEFFVRRFVNGLATHDLVQAVGTFLHFEVLSGLFVGIDQLFLPGVVLLRLPETSDANRLDVGDVTNMACGHFPHCRALYGAQAIARGATAFAARQRGLPGFWRCGVAARVLRRRSLLSDSLRSSCKPNCEMPVVEVLAKYRQAYVQAHADLSTNSMGRPTTDNSFRDKPLFVVDVGASLGDCLLIAAMLFPEGQLRAIAFEPDEDSAMMLREAVALNRLAGDSANSSAIDVRQLAIVQPDALRLKVGSLQATPAGAILDSQWRHSCPQVPWHPEQSIAIHEVPTSSLDEELRGLTVDILVMFANDMELAILQGAQGLLREGRVHCILIMAQSGCPGKHEAISSMLLAIGYRVESRAEGRWLAAAPGPLLPQRSETYATPVIERTVCSPPGLDIQ